MLRKLDSKIFEKDAINLKYTVRSRLSELRLTGIPAIRHKSVTNGFLPMYFTPLIRKPRYPTPAWEFRNGYVKSIVKKR